MRKLLLVLTLGAAALPYGFAYNGETISVSGTATQVLHADGATLQFYLNTGVTGGATSTLSGQTVITAASNPTAAVEAAMAQWNNAALATSANVNLLALQTIGTGANQSDCKNVISIAGSAADLSILGFGSAANPGAVGVTANVYIPTAGATVCDPSKSVPAGTIIDSDILLNPYFQFSTNGAANTRDLQAVVTHEMGHVLGMNHSTLLSATMYPYTAAGQRHLSADEKAFIANFYGASKSLGTINGTVTIAGAPVQFGLVTLTELSGTGAVIGTLTAADGTYSAQVPPGVYNVYAEPFNSFVGATNIYSLTSATGTLDPTAATTAFSATFSGGNSTNPPTFTITAGSASKADIAVTAGVTSLASPFYGIGKAGANGDISQFSGFGGAIPVTGGTDFDLALSGPGIDTTIQIGYIGTNVTVVGSPRKDSSGSTVNGNPIIRQHLSIGSQTTATIGTLWIIKGTALTTVLPLTGILDIEPNAPTITSAQDAESAGKSITSGQYFTIYGSSLANNTRIWNTSTDFTGGVAAGNPLPTSLDGVSVTVNGQPAAVYFTSPGQINAIAPANLTSGPATVTVSNDLSASATYSGATIASAAPSFFIYASGTSFYPIAVHLTAPYPLVSDSAKAHPGETIAIFCNGVAAANGNVVATVAAVPTTGWSLTAGTNTLNILGAALVYAGEYQVNVSLPSTIATGNYTLTLSVPGGSSSSDGITVTLPVGP